MGMKSFGLKHALLMGAAAFGFGMAAAVASPAYAQEATRSYDIPAQDLDDALREFGRQTGRDVLFTPDAVAGKRSGALVGQMTERQAMESLLAGSGLRFEQTASGGYAVQDPNSPTNPGDASGAAPSDDGATAEILVIGSRTLNADIRRSEDGAQPYVVFNRADIERSSATNTEQFLRQSLPMETSAGNNNQGATAINRSTVALRGLSDRETLILVDGRRIATVTAAGSFTQADITGIPLSAIERIEVLPSTASGIYGGGATAGVINIVLRRDYSGAQMTVTYEDSFEGGGGSRRIDLSAGHVFNDGRTELMFSASGSIGDELFIGDRDLQQRGLDRIIANNPAAIFANSNPPLGATTNIKSATGANLTLKPGFGGGALNSPFTYVPYDYAGAGADNGAGLIANAGAYNFDLPETAQIGGAQRSLLNVPEVWSANLSLRQEVTSWATFVAEATTSRQEGSFRENAASSSVFLVPAAAATNPFNQAVYVNVPFVGADFESRSTLESSRVLVGGIFNLQADWRLSSDYVWSTSTWSSENSSGMNFLTGAAITSGTIDAFRDVNTSGADFFPYMSAATINGPGDTTTHALALRASGPLPFISFPGGAARATIVLEGRRDEVDDFTSELPAFSYITTNYAKWQEATAVYAETLLPIFGQANNIPGINLLELQLAVRAEQYHQVGANSTDNYAPTPRVETTSDFSSVDPTISLRWEPIANVMLRASYGTGFLPPEISTLASLPATSTPTFVVDPQRGNEAAGFISLIGDNSHIRPEQSESRSLGIVATPDFAPGLRVSLDWTAIEKTDVITILSPAFVQDDLETYLTYFPERVTRNPDPTTFGVYGVGPITSIHSGYLNLSNAEIEAFDFALDYSLHTQHSGVFSAHAALARAIVDERQVTPSAPVEERLGARGGNLLWRGTVGASWEVDALALNWAVHYVDGYYLRTNHSFVANQGSAEVDSQTYHDLSARYDFGRSNVAILRDTELVLSVANVFDEAPPFDANLSSSAYYSSYGDPHGRLYQVSLRRTF